MYIADINKIFTNEVNKLLRAGWTINAQTMSSINCGEIAKVDMTDGKDVVRIYMYEDNETCDDENLYSWFDCIKIAKCTMIDGKPNNRNRFIPRFSHDVMYTYYEIPRSKGWYVGNRDELINAVRKQYERNEAQSGCTKTMVVYPITAKILPLVRRFPKCKTAHLEDITQVWCLLRDTYRQYRFTVKGTTHMISVNYSQSEAHKGA